MSWKVKQKLRGLLAAETNLCGAASASGGALSVCLVYPNHYRTGMSSLGFQTVYRLLASSPGITCERAFLPDSDDLDEYRRSGAALMSLERQRPLADFDIVAFSTSFEPDYLNIPVILNLARIPLWSWERDASHPLVMAGGAAFFINPEPVADFIDIICVGEGEELVPPLVEAFMSPCEGDRPGLFGTLARIPGIYIPSLYHPRYNGERLAGLDARPGAPLEIQRACPPLDFHSPAASVLLTENTEFGDMFLIEVSRGCPRGCRFCTSGFIYSPFRQHRYDDIAALVETGLMHRGKIGLVGAAVSDYRDIGRLCRSIVERGAKVSVSSLRIDRLDPDMVDALVACGHKTISLAPEGGSQRLRDLIRKNLTESQILDACDMLISRDILNLKLYVIIGLPTETDTDMAELLRLVMVIRERVVARARANGRLGGITISVNPFIPKPFTPFQWCGMEPLPSLERKVKLLENGLRGVANVHLKVENLKGCYLQALLSRGDRRCAALLADMAAGANLKKAARNRGIDTDTRVYRTIPLDEPLPWGVLECADTELLRAEYGRAFSGGGGDDKNL